MREPRAPLMISYATPRGAGVMRSIPRDDDAIEKVLRQIRRPAQLFDRETNEKVGEVYRCVDADHDGHRYPHWAWWFETQGGEQAAP